MIEGEVGSRGKAVAAAGGRTLLDMNGYQWTVLFAAWLGWGFDIFDSLLFNYVAPNAVPTLLGLQIGTPAAQQATLRWTGVLTSLLLIGWAIGGILFGRVADRIGRTKTLLLTMAMYALGTAACAFAPNMATLVVFRIIASLGIGGEWAAGAAMVAEVVPEKRRVEAGALLYTAAPVGLFLATIITFQIQGVYFKGSPEVAWRYVFLFGLLPALVAFLVRLFVKEPERWESVASKAAPPRLREIFTPEYRMITFSGFLMALVALITWWSCNAFLPVVATGLASQASAGLDREAATHLAETWKATAGNWFNIGGLIGTLLTVPASKMLGRRVMFTIYFLASGLAVLAAFGLPMDPHTRLYMYFPIGLSVFGVFGAFTYYLPELYPTRLRGTGAGFCYNSGRLIAAIGPFIVGSVAARGAGALGGALQVLFYVGFVPLAGLLVMPWVLETKDRALID
ncbi:MAG: MFS transporter [Vicinamibacterales bacterium]|nr:MFS transporter [Vicinamibacterales bacterium]